MFVLGRSLPRRLQLVNQPGDVISCVRACVRAGGRAGGRAAGVLDDIVDSGVWAPGSLAERRGSHRRVGIDLSIEHRSARFRQVVCVQL
jgi:hypothetical protein